jgi:hypothetical protein
VTKLLNVFPAGHESVHTPVALFHERLVTVRKIVPANPVPFHERRTPSYPKYGV